MQIVPANEGRLYQAVTQGRIAQCYILKYIYSIYIAYIPVCTVFYSGAINQYQRNLRKYIG